MRAQALPDISFFPLPTSTLPSPNMGEAMASMNDEQLEDILRQVAADAPPESSVFTASACGSDHHVHVYVGVHDAATMTSILVHDFTTDILC